MIGALDQAGALDGEVGRGPQAPPARFADPEIEALLSSLDAALTEIETLPEGRARDASVEALQTLLLVYGEGMQRMVDKVASLGGEQILQLFMGDELIEHLLVLHDVHPEDLETRAERALDQVRPYLQSHGGDVEFLELVDGVARLRLNGSCDGCPSSAVTLKSAVEEALKSALPEVSSVEAVGEEEPGGKEHPGIGTFVPVSEISFGRPGGATADHAH